MGIHVADHRRQGIAHHPGIRVQKQKIAATTTGQPLVVGDRVSHVVLVGDENSARELGADHVWAAICAAVVHDNDLSSQLRFGCAVWGFRSKSSRLAILRRTSNLEH
jgi:hypothetical protein